MRTRQEDFNSYSIEAKLTTPILQGTTITQA